MPFIFNFSFSTTEAPIIPNGMENGEFNKITTYCMYAVLGSFSVVNNFRVISIVLTTPRRKRKDGNILIAHLSLVTIFLTFLDGDYILLRYSNLEFLDPSYASCVFRSFTGSITLCIVPLNVAAVNYEKTHAYKRLYPCGKFLVFRCICLIWTSAVLGNLPSIFAVQDSPSSQQCIDILLLGSFYITSFYELLKLILFITLPVVYIIHTLIHIRSTIYKYLHHSKKEVPVAVKQIRLVFYHGLIFSLLWLPFGIMLFGYKFNIRMNYDESSSNEGISRGESPTISFMVLHFLFFAYISMNPLIHLHLNEHINGIKWYQFTYQNPIKNRNEVNAGVGEEVEQDNTNLSNRFSRCSTFHKSQTPEPIVYSWNNPIKEFLV